MCCRDCAIYRTVTPCVAVIVCDVELGMGMWGELASHKRLFNPPPQFLRLGTQCPALMSHHVYLCMCFLWIFWNLWI